MSGDTFETSDLNVAAFLLALDYPLLHDKGQRDSRHVFTFPASASDDARGFFAGGMVRARSFANALRDLKALIYHNGR